VDGTDQLDTSSQYKIVPPPQVSSQASPVESKYKIVPPTEKQESIGAKAWRIINTPIGGSAPAPGAESLLAGLSGAANGAEHWAQMHNHPLVAGYAGYTSESSKRLQEKLAQYTRTPLALATFGLGPIAEAASGAKWLTPIIPSVMKDAQALAAISFGMMNAKQVGTSRQPGENQSEALGRRVEAAGGALLGTTAALTSDTVPAKTVRLPWTDEFRDKIAPDEILARSVGDKLHIAKVINKAQGIAKEHYELLKTVIDGQNPDGVIDSAHATKVLTDLKASYDILKQKAPAILSQIQEHMNLGGKKMGFEYTKQLHTVVQEAAGNLDGPLGSRLNSFSKYLKAQLNATAEKYNMSGTYETADALHQAIHSSPIKEMAEATQNESPLGYFKDIDNLQKDGRLNAANSKLEFYGLDTDRLTFDLKQARRLANLDKSIAATMGGRRVGGGATSAMGMGSLPGYSFMLVLGDKLPRMASVRFLGEGGFLDDGIMAGKVIASRMPKVGTPTAPQQAPPQAGPQQAGPQPQAPQAPQGGAPQQAPPAAPAQAASPQAAAAPAPKPIPPEVINRVKEISEATAPTPVPKPTTSIGMIRDNLTSRAEISPRQAQYIIKNLLTNSEKFATPEAKEAFMKRALDSLKDTEGALNNHQRRMLYQTPDKAIARSEADAAEHATAREKGVAELVQRAKQSQAAPNIGASIIDIEDELKTRVGVAKAKALMKGFHTKYPDPLEYQEALLEHLDEAK
jgi:hypothetical protein